MDRVDRLRLLGECFEKRPLPAANTESITVRIWFDKQVVRWVRERQHYSFLQEEDTGTGVEMVYAVHNLSEIMPWLRSWGAAAEILSPPELREQLRQEAHQLAKMLT